MIEEYEGAWPIDYDCDAVELYLDIDEVVPTFPVDLEWYEGDYSVTPTWNTQVLETSQKRMKADVEVSSIIVQQVDNQFGGQTLSI